MLAVSAWTREVFTSLGRDICVGICTHLNWVFHFSFEFCVPRQLLKEFSSTKLSKDSPFMCLSVLGAVEGGEFMRAEFEILLKTWFYFFVFWVFGALLLFCWKCFGGGPSYKIFLRRLSSFPLTHTMPSMVAHQPMTGTHMCDRNMNSNNYRILFWSFCRVAIRCTWSGGNYFRRYYEIQLLYSTHLMWKHLSITCRRQKSGRLQEWARMHFLGYLKTVVILCSSCRSSVQWHLPMCPNVILGNSKLQVHLSY